MSIVAFLALLCLAAAAGQRAVRPVAARRGLVYTAVLSLIAGLVIVYLGLVALDLLGLGWRRATVVPLLALLAFAGLRKRRPRRAATPEVPLGWGEGVAIFAFVVYLVATWRLWNINPDFIYHWGIKAKKFYLASGFDFEFLTQIWTFHLHPDYPNLVPALFALTAILAGGFDELAMALWSVVFLGALLVAARELLIELRATTFAHQATMAAVGLMTSWFGVGYLLAGGADSMIALAMMAAAVALVGRADSAADRQIGWIAAFAAAAKIEGMALAAFMIGSHGLRRWRSASSSGDRVRAALAVSSPTLLVSLVWAWQTWRHDLFLTTNTGDFRLARLAEVLPALFDSLLIPNWHYLSFTLLLLPILWIPRRMRPIGIVCSWQLAFYLFVYLSAPVDSQHYVATSAARLFYHLLPTILVTLMVIGDHWSRQRQDIEP